MEEMMKKEKRRGLKALRGAKGKKPQCPCENCKCTRYVPCKCERQQTSRERREAERAAA